METIVSIHQQRIITKTCFSRNIVYPPHSVTPVDGVPATPKSDQGTLEQNNSNSQFSMMYNYVLGLLSITVESIVAENAVKDRLGIHRQRSFANDLF